MLIFTQAGVQAFMADVIAGALNNCRIHLYKNDYVPTVFDVVAAFTEADYTGYAFQSVLTAAWNAVIQADGSAGVIGPGLFFDASGTAVANTIYGYFVTDLAGTTLLWAERFAAPVGITGPGNGFTLVPQLNGVSQSS